MRWKISAGVDGGLSRGSRVRRPWSEDPHKRQPKFFNNTETVRILLAWDELDITYIDSFGCTALHWACYKGRAECVALLGQDRRMTSKIINIENNHGKKNSAGSEGGPRSRVCAR